MVDGILGRQQLPGPASHHLMSRRSVLAGLSIASMAGCDLLSTDPEGAAGGREQRAANGKEAPSLSRRVKAGELPAVAERLPTNPMVVEPTDKIGTYGGTWHTALLGAADEPWLSRTIGYESLTRWTSDWSGTMPNLAESVEASADGREFVITLRAELKWSDGKPFTADDLLFAWNDVMLNSDLYPVPPEYVLVGGEPGRIEKVSDSSVRVTFPKPSGLFELHLAYLTRPLVEHPRHYLEAFHLDFNADAAADGEAAGYSNWTEYFLAMSDIWANPELPRLHPWLIRQGIGEGSRLVAERNPYYFKTDPEESQLPYIDEVIYEIVSDEEVMLLKASNGEIDFHTRHFNTLPNKPTLAASRESGNYDFIELLPAYENEMIIGLNLSHSNSALREVFQNKNFRIALSHAINRAELVDIVFQRQGEPWQAAPRPESEFYDEEFATQYTEYDVDLANEYLDREGFQRDGDGYRLGPDGNRITFSVEIAQPALVPYWSDGMELVAGYWEEVGIKARLQPLDRSLFWEHLEANSYDAAVWIGYGGLTYGVMLEPGYYFPYSPFHAKYASAWGTWFSSRGESGEEPPARTKEQMELYWQLAETPDENERKELLRQILEIAKEEFYVMGTAITTEGYGLKRNDFHNVPKQIPESHIFGTPGGSNPEQYYID